MPKKKEYLENIIGRELYDFYRKNRRKPSKVIDEYAYFIKAMHGMLQELRQMMRETDNGVHLRGFGVLYKKPFGEYMKKMSIFTHKKAYRKTIEFFLEDEYIRRQFFTANMMSLYTPTDNIIEDKSTAILLHRKLKLKK